MKGINKKRDAGKVIQGFIYQFCVSLDAWMRLARDELLILEGAEDLDVHKGETVETIQVKHTQVTVSLNSADIQKAIANFWTYREKNPDKKICYRFTATSLPAEEKGAPFGKGVKGLELWGKENKGSEEIQALIAFLKNISSLPETLKQFLSSATEADIQQTFFQPVSWDLGEKPLAVLRPHIEAALIYHGHRYPEPVPATEAKKTFPILMLKIIDEIISDEKQGLTLADFLLAFEQAASSFYQEMRALQAKTDKGSGSILQVYHEAPENKYLTDLAYLESQFSEQPPIPPHSVARKTLIQNVQEIVSAHAVAFVIGSSGVGKTTLASHYLEDSGAGYKWLDLRGLEPTHIKQILRSLNMHIHINRDPKDTLVLDDLDLRKGYRVYEHELKLLLFNASLHNRHIIVTCQSEAPQRLLHDAWLPPTCMLKVGNFTLDEIAEVAVANGCPDQPPPSTWASIISFGTHGHPQLVRAKIRNLQARNWAYDETDTLNPQAVKDEKRDVRYQLLSEIPDNARDLAYRLSLVIGTFGRKVVEIISQLPPEIRMHGEAFDILVGPWIEQTTKDRFRVSPLLANQGMEVFSQQEQRKTHSAICIGYLTQKTALTQNEVSNMFMHGIASQDAGVLMGIVKGTLDNLFTNAKHEVMKHVAEELFWFYALATKKGQRIFSDNLHLNFMLRLIQYRFFCLSDEGSDASELAERLLDDMHAALAVAEGHEYLNEHTELVTYSSMLISIEKRLNPGLTIGILPRFAELSQKYKDTLPQMGPPSSVWMRRNGGQKFDPVSIFLEGQTMRGNGIADLEAIFDCIDALPEKQKGFMLKVLAEGKGIIRSLCNNAWLKEVTGKEVKDVWPIVLVYEKGIAYAEKWGLEYLKANCVLCISVLYNEYGHDLEKAAEIITKYEDVFAEHQGLLLNQKAKLFFNNSRHAEAMPLWEQTLSVRERLDDIDQVFALKNAAISFAKSGHWDRAKNYMSQCLDIVTRRQKEDRGFLEFMDVGLIADMAFADWKLEEWESSIKGFDKALSALEKLESKHGKNLNFIAVYARTGHMISWAAQDGEVTQSLTEPPPCCACNPDAGDDFKDFRVRPSIYLWTLLSGAEQHKGLDIGITKKFIDKSHKTTFVTAILLSNAKQLDLAFENCDFSNVVSLAVEFLRMKKALEKHAGDSAEIRTEVTADQLPAYEELDQNMLAHIVFHAVFAACVALSMQKQPVQRYLSQWKKQIKKLKLMDSTVLSEFLRFIEDHEPKIEPLSVSKQDEVEQCKFVIKSIPSLSAPEEIDPVTLFSIHFYVMNILNNQIFKKHLETEILRAVMHGWQVVAKSKVFALRAPKLNVPRIEAACNSERVGGGFGKVASILLEVCDCVNVNVPDDTKNYLKQVAMGA